MPSGEIRAETYPWEVQLSVELCALLDAGISFAPAKSRQVVITQLGSVMRELVQNGTKAVPSWPRIDRGRTVDWGTAPLSCSHSRYGKP
jgi:hypothetical protein